MDPAHRPPSLRRSRPRWLILAYARSRPGRLLDLVDAAGESGRLALWQHLLHDLGRATEPPRQALLCSLTLAADGPYRLVELRAALLELLPGFLHLREVSWDSPSSLVVGLLMVASNYASAKLTRGRLQGSALAEITSGWSPTAP